MLLYVISIFFPLKSTKQVSSKKHFFTLLNFLCTLKKNSCTLVCTGVHLKDHCSEVFYILKVKVIHKYIDKIVSIDD